VDVPASVREAASIAASGHAPALAPEPDIIPQVLPPVCFLFVQPRQPTPAT
jgi:hypothetical protein